MRKFLLMSSAAFLFLTFSVPVRAQDDTKAVIDKAIKAHGGAENFAKFEKKGSHTKVKGKLHQFGGVDLSLETFAQVPAKYKTVIQVEIMGMKINQVMLFNGDKFGMYVNGKDVSSFLDEKAHAEIKEQLYQETVLGKVLLKDKSVELSPLGEVQVEGKPAVGIRVVSKGHRDVNVYFDKASGLLAKMEFRALDIQSKQEHSTERIVSDYKDFDGVPQPRKVAILRDGEKFMDLEILETKIVDKFDDDEFEKP